jgi:hypothetical protein
MFCGDIVSKFLRLPLDDETSRLKVALMRRVSPFVLGYFSCRQQRHRCCEAEVVTDFVQAASDPVLEGCVTGRHALRGRKRPVRPWARSCWRA